VSEVVRARSEGNAEGIEDVQLGTFNHRTGDVLESESMREARNDASDRVSLLHLWGFSAALG
jgi:hypothetical protein